MLLSLATAVLTALATATHTDTTFQVSPGMRLSVNNFGGDIAVSAWGKNAVRVEAEHSDRAHVMIAADGPNLDVRPMSRHGIPLRVDFNIMVPVWMPLILQGIYCDIMTKGMKGEITAETVKGEVRVEGGEGFVRASSVEGAVSVEDVRGRVEVNAVNEGVRVAGCAGEIVVNAINGDVTLDDNESPMLEASTVSGDVLFLGRVSDHGRYNLSTHDGDLVFGMPERANATVSVSTFNGDFESAFPVQLDRTRRGRRFNFTLGSGSALMNLESFEGTIQLRRPGDLRARVKLRGLEHLERVHRVEKLEKLKEVEDVNHLERVRVIRRR